MQELEVLYRAFHSRFGVRVIVEEPKLYMSRLYAERKKNPELADLAIKLSPVNPAKEVYIVKRSLEDAEKA